MLAATLGAALAVSALRMPEFSWDTVPVFIHMCQASGPFNDTQLQYLAKFPMVTVEKAQGLNATEQPYASLPEEGKILQALQAVKEVNNDIVTIFYYNSILDWNMYGLHEKLLQHPDYWLRDAYGNVVHLVGDHVFPQPPGGMLVFDMAQEVVQEFWASECLNQTNTPYADGCFADQAARNLENMTHFNFTDQQKVDFAKGHTDALLLVQKKLNETGNSVLVTNGYVTPGLVATMIETFDSSLENVQLLQETSSQGYLVQAHAGYAADGPDDHCRNITNSLAAFLVAANKYSYYGCSRGWYLDPDWSVWHPDYDKPLGPPMGPATVDGDYWRRSFSSGTNVTWNSKTLAGTIEWATSL